MPNLKKDEILVSRFSLVEKIGEGGMGQVWRVQDLELEIQIAIKVLNPQLMSQPNRIDLLKNECRNTRRLVHPNIVRVFDFHRFKDLVFISMEYIEGRDLRDYRGEFSTGKINEMGHLIRPVINALGYAHQRGLVHRDVKAGNILIDRRQTPRLTDFGIAGVFKSGYPALEITSGGSLFCMSPQQLEGRPSLPADDIYALGALLYELCTGYPPFYPDITREKILHEPPVPVNRRLNQIAGDVAPIPEALEDLITSMLAKRPEDRPVSMEETEDRFVRVLNFAVDDRRSPAAPQHGPAEPDAVSARPTIITPVSVRPAASGKELALFGRSHRVKGAALAVAFVLLVTGGLWLWHYLAGRPAGQSPAKMTISESEPAQQKPTAKVPQELPQPAPDPATIAAEKAQADKSLAQFLQLKQELEAKGVSQWGGEAYREMTQLADEADRLLLENAYAAAAAKYESATVKAGDLSGRIKPVFERLLVEGQEAIDQGNAELARQKFSIALMIDPENRLARHSLQRAQNLDAVRQLLESGSRHEHSGNVAFAHADYQEALRLDPESEEARKALERVKGRIRDEEFEQLMSQGLTALHHNDYQNAREKLLKAKSFRPASQEVADALAQVDQSIRLARIEAYRQKAATAEKAENWAQALDAYEQALAVDANVQFAVRGKERALDRIRIDKRIDFFLQQPAALESDRQLENANELIAEIKEIDPMGPQLRSRLEKLARIVDVAQTPVKIIIESDTLTDIVVYRVGKLGRFESRELSLRPGTYTVVGTRDGFKDVRKQVIVKPGQGPLRISIRCEVQI